MPDVDEQPSASPASRGPEELQRAMAETLATGDIAAHFDAEVELENLILADADKEAAALRYEEAAQRFEFVAELNRNLSKTLAGARPADDESTVPTAEKLLDWQGGCDRMALYSTGRAELMRGQAQATRRNPGEAAKRFEAAEAAFRAAEAGDESGALKFLGDYSAALREAAAAAEESVRGDYGAAAASYQRASRAYEDLVATVHDLGASLEDGAATLAPTLDLEAASIAGGYEKASYMEYASQGDYEAAEESAANLAKLVQAALDAMPEGLPQWQIHAVRAQLASAEADRARAKAFVCRNEHRWDDALAAYSEARAKLRDAADEMLRSGLPDAVATQEALMAMSSVTIAAEIRQCREEQRLTEEAERLRLERDQFVARIAAAGVSVTNIQEATAVAEQTTQITLRVEQSVRERLPELRAALEAAGLGADGDRLAAEAAALEASQEHSASFLDRAKGFTERVASIVKNVGEAAAPIIPVLRVLGPLVGVPIPF